MLGRPAARFVAHAPDAEFFKGANERMLETAAQLGYRPTAVTPIGDGYGRTVFEVYRLVQ